MGKTFGVGLLVMAAVTLFVGSIVVGITGYYAGWLSGGWLFVVISPALLAILSIVVVMTFSIGAFVTDCRYIPAKDPKEEPKLKRAL